MLGATVLGSWPPGAPRQGRWAVSRTGAGGCRRRRRRSRRRTRPASSRRSRVARTWTQPGVYPKRHRASSQRLAPELVAAAGEHRWVTRGSQAATGTELARRGLVGATRAWSDDQHPAWRTGEARRWWLSASLSRAESAPRWPACTWRPWPSSRWSGQAWRAPAPRVRPIRGGRSPPRGPSHRSTRGRRAFTRCADRYYREHPMEPLRHGVADHHPVMAAATPVCCASSCSFCSSSCDAGFRSKTTFLIVPVKA